MLRRQFLKSAAAAASTPLLPASLLSVSTAASTPTDAYAKAMSFASDEAYFSADHLRTSLGLSEEIGKIIVSRLKAERVIGDMGRSGLMFSRTFYPKQAKLAGVALSKAATAAAKTKAAGATTKVKSAGTSTKAKAATPTAKAETTTLQNIDPKDLPMEPDEQELLEPRHDVEKAEVEAELTSADVSTEVEAVSETPTTPIEPRPTDTEPL